MVLLKYHIFFVVDTQNQYAIMVRSNQFGGPKYYKGFIVRVMREASSENTIGHAVGMLSRLIHILFLTQYQSLEKMQLLGFLEAYIY